MIVNAKSSPENIKFIQEQFNQVISYSQGFNPHTNKLFEKWFEAKRDFIEAWDGHLIYEGPKVTFELSKKDRDTRLDEFIDNIAMTYNNEALAIFIHENRDGFFNNRVIVNKTEFKIPEGMKLVKAFKFFETDEIALKDIQTQASMIIQEDKIEGTLCFSVHPLDFLSVSENTYNWRSCHALDGDYRAGNISYMMDKATIVCYLRGAENAELPNFPGSVRWNSKKWRMLLYFSDKWDVIFAGRQYPFFSDSALDVVKTHLLNSTIKSYNWSFWHDDQISRFNYKDKNIDGGSLMYPYVIISNEIMKLNEVVEDDDKSLQFNDLLRSSCYSPYYMFKHYRPIGEIPHIHVGGEAPCLHCEGDCVVVSDSMLCESCELEFGQSESEHFAYCDCCDRRVAVTDLHYIASTGSAVCEWCYQDRVTRCECCGGDFFNDEIIFDKPTHSYRCQSCATRRRAYPTFSSAVHGVYYRPEEIVEATPAENVQRLRQWIDDFFEEEND